jgi:hypothetical protein
MSACLPASRPAAATAAGVVVVVLVVELPLVFAIHASVKHRLSFVHRPHLQSVKAGPSVRALGTCFFHLFTPVHAHKHTTASAMYTNAQCDIIL